MRTASAQLDRELSAHATCPLVLPAWVADMFKAQDDSVSTERKGTSVDVRNADGLCLARAIVPQANTLPPSQMQRKTTEAYLAIARALRDQTARHPIRIWNYIPDIHAPMGDRLSRYMVFNAGRFAAYTEMYGQRQAFDEFVTTATGVGHGGHALVIHVLAAVHPGRNVDNPRQVRSFHYASRFGPMPPCFARATMLPSELLRACPALVEEERETALADSALLLAAGTSSVSGQDSLHQGDVYEQTRLTLLNLATLVREVAGGGNGSARLNAADLSPWLRAYRNLRIYFFHPQHAPHILSLVREAMGHLTQDRIELVRADICRPELLVEIEGTAWIARTSE